MIKLGTLTHHSFYLDPQYVFTFKIDKFNAIICKDIVIYSAETLKFIGKEILKANA